MLVSVPVPCSLVWGLFVVFTGLHLLANHRAVSVVCMETLNKNRCSPSTARHQSSCGIHQSSLSLYCTLTSHLVEYIALTGCVFAGCTL